MTLRSAVRTVPAFLVAGALVASPVALEASGFQLAEQNASGLGNAYAGQAAGVKDASAIFFNPANLTRLPGKQFVLAVSPIGIATNFGDTGSGRPFLPSTPPLTIPVPLGGAGGDAGGWVPVPNAYFSLQAGSAWWLGIGVNVPFGLETDWEADWVGRFKAVKSKVQTINVNPTVAVKLSESFSLGAGLSYQRLDAELSQNVAYGGIAFGAAGQTGSPAVIGSILTQLGGMPGLALEGPTVVEGDSSSWGWNVGATLKVGEAGRIAATYRSKVEHDLEGDATFTGAPTFSTSGPAGPVGTVLNGRFADGPVVANIELPDTLSVAASYEGEKVELLADWTWTGWGTIQDLVIDRTDGTPFSTVPLLFEDTWRIGLGLNYRLSEPWTLRVGTAFDKTPVPDEHRTPRLPDQDRVWAAVGFQYRIGKSGAFDIGYAHLFVEDGTSNLPNQDAPTSPPSGTLVGGYTDNINVLSIQFKYSF